MILEKIRIKKIVFVFFTTMSFTNLSAQIKQPIDYVNPFIGTEKSSHHTVWESRGATFPGVLRPFGMVQITPDGYIYSDKKIKSFSFINHASGYFSNGSFNIMAFTGDSIATEKTAADFDHTNEIATPYNYQVLLKNSGIIAAFIATERTALCKFTFSKSSRAHLVLSDITNTTVIDSNTISGRCGGYYFTMKLSKAFDSVNPYSGKDEKPVASADNTFPSAIIINYETKENEIILVKIGFSTTSFKGVENNIRMEQPGWDFEQTKLQSKKIWNKKLTQIEVKTPSENTKEIFYTALYHSMFMPAILSDADSPKDIYGPLFPWDTYRTKHPLITLLDPRRESDMVASVLAEYDRTGWLPTDNMMGNHNTELILDSYVKGATGFNTSKAAEAMSKSLIVPPYARREMSDFVRYKFVPANITSNVTHSLEYAYNSWAVANFLEKTGNKKKYLKQYHILTERAGYYKNSFDAVSGFMKAKTISGKWTQGGYAEGTDWTYSWYVPHDVQGLINLMGGKATFSKRLSICFKDGHYVHDNEPPLHYAYLFNFCGEPWKTQFWARQIVEENYSTDPGGLPGNDDLGTLSSWFVFSAMGFYPVTPGTTQYQIGSPVFEETIIHLYNGHQFVLKANQVSRQNKFIQSASINGMPFNRSWITHEEIVSGKTLVLEMGPNPNKAWGSSEAYKPYSMTNGTPAFIIKNISISANVVKANEPIRILINVQNHSKVIGTFSVPLIVDGKIFDTISTVLDPGENKIIHAGITLYYEGMHSIEVPGKAAMKLIVQKTIPAFSYSDLKIPLPPLVKLSDSINVSAKVKNTGSIPASTPVKLFMNGVECQSKIIFLNPGEEKEIKFNYPATREGICRISIADLKPVMINILIPTLKKNCDYSTLKSLKPLLILDFDEAPLDSIHDFSGQGNNGIVKGNLKWVDGVFGKGIQTDASLGNYIVFPDSSALNQLGETTALTLMAWVYPNDEKNFADIISKGDWNSLQLKGSNQFINFYTNGWEGHEATATVPDNWNQHWHHLAGVADGKYFKLYVDGKLVETKQGELRNPKGETGTADYSHNLWNIGRNETAVDRVFHGAIDDVMILNSALTQEQVIDLMLHNF